MTQQCPFPPPGRSVPPLGTPSSLPTPWDAPFWVFVPTTALLGLGSPSPGPAQREATSQKRAGGSVLSYGETEARTASGCLPRVWECLQAPCSLPSWALNSSRGGR